MTNAFVKDAADVVDYVIDWSAVLASGETISTSTWAVDTGITADSNTNTDTTTTIWISGGTERPAGYKAYNTIVTSASRTFKRYIVITIGPIGA
jgi:hypothetical protein